MGLEKEHIDALITKLDEVKESNVAVADAIKAHNEKPDPTPEPEPKEVEKVEPEPEKIPARKIDFSRHSEATTRKMEGYHGILNVPTRLLNDAEKEMRAFSDDAYILGTLLKVNPRETKYWQRFDRSNSALKKALDTATAGEGAEWVPTGMSAELIEKFRLESKVAGLFPDIVMPTNPYDNPFISGDITFYLIGESTSDSPTAPPASTPTTGKQTFDAVKLKARVLFSDELEEDSIIPILPALKEELGLAGAEHIDDAIINGDATGAHMDSDVTDSRDHRKAWDGLRNHIQAACKKDLSTFNTANVRGIRSAMGKYGIKSGNLAMITSTVSQYNMLGLTEVITVDKYGPAATILSGELGKFDGMPVIVSEFVRTNLNASGVYDGVTTTKTMLLVVNRRAFMLGTRGLPKLSFKSDDDVDQNTLILSFRKDFQPRWTPSATVLTAGYGYNF